MVSIISGDGSIVGEIADDDPRILAHRALQNAIKQIAEAQYRAAGKPKSKPRGPAFVATGPEVRALVEASSDVLSGKITPEEAMAMVLDPNVMQQRFPDASAIQNPRKRTR